MSLNKRDSIRAVARQTSLTHKQAEEAVQALIDVWFEELAGGGKITINGFLILEVKQIVGTYPWDPTHILKYGRISVRTSYQLKEALKK